MEYLSLIFDLIVIGLKSEIANDIKIKDNKILVRFSNNTIAEVSLEEQF